MSHLKIAKAYPEDWKGGGVPSNSSEDKTLNKDGIGGESFSRCIDLRRISINV
jgi:hypothetical protein